MIRGDEPPAGQGTGDAKLQKIPGEALKRNV